MTASKIVAAAASGVGGAGEDVDNLMNSFIYEGNGGSATITTDLDYSDKGGMVFFKRLDNTQVPAIFDTVRGAGKWIRSNSSSAEATDNASLTAFGSSGFTLAADGNVGSVNTNNGKYKVWSFLQQRKFFDIVTYTGDGTTFRDIAHNLGSVPGHIMIKKRLGGSNTGWVNWHRTFSDYDNVFLSGSSAKYNDGSNNSLFGQASNMTSTHFELGGNGNISYINENGSTYVAYLFAHNNNDGGFGPDADQDIIKCGSYTGDNGTPSSLVNLGFEPQFLLIKNITSAGTNWFMVDNASTIPHDQNTPYWVPNGSSQTEQESTEIVNVHPKGFKLQGSTAMVNQLGETYIYIAIRRGPLSFHDDLTRSKVFSVESGYGSNHVMDFMADFNVHTRYTGENRFTISRLTGDQYILTDTTDSEGDSGTSSRWWDKGSRRVDLQTGWYTSHGDLLSLNWRRVPGFFEEVCYDGTGSVANIDHNLNAVPEMMWIRRRNSADNWVIYHKAMGNTKYMRLNADSGQINDGSANRFNHTTPTSSVFTVNNDTDVNASGSRYIARLFATQDGISKVGSYTGNGSTQNIDCGFTNGCSFIMIKKYSSSAGWKWHDSELGIASGNDPFIEFNNNNGYNTSFDLIDPLSSGFTVNNYADWNGNGDTFIFYAVAA